MNNNILKFVVLSIPLISFASEVKRQDLFGVNIYSPHVVITDIRLDCKSHKELYPDYDLEILSTVKEKPELYKLVIVSRPNSLKKELSVSRNNQETCRYLVEQNISIIDNQLSYKILDKVSLNSQLCEGRIEKKFEVVAHSQYPFKFNIDFKKVSNFCSRKDAKGDLVREYLAKPLKEVGKVNF